MAKGIYKRVSQEKPCEWCGKQFKGIQSRRFCSQACQRSATYYRAKQELECDYEVKTQEVNVSSEKRLLIGRLWTKTLEELDKARLQSEREAEEKIKKNKAVFVHYTSSSGRWEKVK